MKIAGNPLDLFFPKRCICCKTIVQKNTEFICESCYLQLNFVPNVCVKNSIVERKIKGLVLFESGTSLLYYDKGGVCQKLIHLLKYKGKQNLGEFFARLISRKLLQGKTFFEYDCIVPVPLHKKKEKKRGYNQMDSFGEYLGKLYNVNYIKDFLIRTEEGVSQTKKTTYDRFQGVATSFIVNPKYRFKKMSVLLIDDVITTGATLTSCLKCLNNSGYKVSFFTIASVE